MSTVYYRQGLTGGASTDLDGQDGTALVDNDLAIVADGTDIYYYQLDATSGAAESSPTIIAPDTNPSTKRWLLQNVYSVTSGVVPPTGVSLKGNVLGMVMTNAADVDHDITVSAGSCMDGTGIKLITQAAAITKQVDAPWAAGTNAGGLLTGGTLSANTLYIVYSMRKDADGTGDIGFADQGAILSTPLAAGYSNNRIIGFFWTDASSNIRPFVMSEDIIELKTAFKILSGVNNASLLIESVSAYIPAGYVKEIFISGDSTAGAVNVSYAMNDTAGAIVMATTASSGAFSTDIAKCTWIPVKTSWIYMNTSSNAVDVWMKRIKISR